MNREQVLAEIEKAQKALANRSFGRCTAQEILAILRQLDEAMTARLHRHGPLLGTGEVVCCECLRNWQVGCADSKELSAYFAAPDKQEVEA